MAMKRKINPLTMNLDMISDGESWAVKQKLNPLTWNFDMVGEWDVKMKYNPFTSNFDMVSEWGWGGGWQPWENTIAYYQVNSSDTSSNVYDNYWNNDATRYWTASYETLSSWKRVINFTWSNWLYCWNKVISSQPYTINLWLYQNWSQSPDNTIISNQNDDWNYWNILAYYDETTLIDFYWWWDWNWYSYSTDNGAALSTWTWHNVVVVVNWNTIQFYVDSVLIKTNTYAVAPDFTNSTDLSIWFLRSNWQGSSNFRFFNGKLSEMIFESKARTVQEIIDHYNQTKALYEGGWLPDAYQEVEYIESTWTQYINTWFQYTQTTWKVEAKFIPTVLWGDYPTYRLAWAYNGSDRSFIMYNGVNPAYIGIWWNDYSTSIAMSANTLYEVAAEITTPWTVNYTLNWNTANISYTWSLATSRDYLLFCNNEDWTPWNYGQYKLFYYKMYEAGTLVRDFVPCYRKSDNAAWLYDLVEWVFYTNQGTGDFIIPSPTPTPPTETVIYVEVNDTDYEPSEILITVPDDLPTNTQSFNNMLVKDTDFNFFNVYVPNVWDSNNPIPWLLVSVAWSYISWTYDSDYDAFIVNCWAISASQDDITIEVTPELDHDLTFTVEFSFDWISIYWDEWTLYL